MVPAVHRVLAVGDPGVDRLPDCLVVPAAISTGGGDRDRGISVSAGVDPAPSSFVGMASGGCRLVHLKGDSGMLSLESSVRL